MEIEMKKAIAVATIFAAVVVFLSPRTSADEREKLIYKATKLSTSDVMVTCRNGAEVQVKKVSEKIVILSCEN